MRSLVLSFFFTLSVLISTQVTAADREQIKQSHKIATNIVRLLESDETSHEARLLLSNLIKAQDENKRFAIIKIENDYNMSKLYTSYHILVEESDKSTTYLITMTETRKGKGDPLRIIDVSLDQLAE